MDRLPILDDFQFLKSPFQPAAGFNLIPHDPDTTLYMRISKKYDTTLVIAVGDQTGSKFIFQASYTTGPTQRVLTERHVRFSIGINLEDFDTSTPQEFLDAWTK